MSKRKIDLSNLKEKEIVYTETISIDEDDIVVDDDQDSLETPLVSDPSGSSTSKTSSSPTIDPKTLQKYLDDLKKDPSSSASISLPRSPVLSKAQVEEVIKHFSDNTGLDSTQ